MDPYCIIIDSRLMAARLPRCLATLHHAVARHPDKVDIRVVSDDDNGNLHTLTRRIGAHFETIRLGSIGARSNEMVRRTPGATLIFPTPRMRLVSDWLDKADHLLTHHQWDAVLLTPRRRPLSQGFKRLWQREPEAGTLCVRRDWFERIGGFDPSLDESAHSDLLARLRACQARVLEFPL
ncbi:hypothetical protein SAMN05192555_1204 [Franzmannia pantelleriensis]|uniref:Glycosyl transferase family 2 n=1 Tax=Franzmannia pantelleriensis TaxID=48727 RepID=A0A1G9W6H6_9GAMM|nr:hypothetical protein [Halomonas pantelleriensis]SDM80138.1 hypothetical protein SAMN05192555_1204 [Halomonas pantelleriensis]